MMTPGDVADLPRGDDYHDDDDADVGAGDDNDSNDDDDNSDDNDDAPDDDAIARAAGLRRSERVTKGSTTRYTDYGLLMAARRTARGGARRAILRDGVVLFSDADLNDARPIPVEDRDEYAFGVILQQYSIVGRA